MASRHRGQYDPANKNPYELSRSRIENFVQCPACFYLKQVRGVEFPRIPGFNINEATDVLLKRDFDKYRGKVVTHPFLINQGLPHLIPFQHEDFEKWTQSLQFGAAGRMNFVHEPTNLLIGGGLDDIWLNTENNRLHIVDYKSTSQKSKGKEITLDDPWKESYKRQMDLYVWIMRNKGFDVDSLGYFLYCDGDRFGDYDFLQEEDATMKFKMSLIPYETNEEWIEKTLMDIKECLIRQVTPNHNDNCEFGALFQGVINLTKSGEDTR
jgi:hypothetical protein